MLFKNASEETKEEYKKLLIAISSLSRLFSKKETPYLEYRIGENLYCKAFRAKNVSRDCSAIDAVNEEVGVGIKTFQGTNLQKIAEFNKDRIVFHNLPSKELILKISELRNERIEFAKRNYGIKSLIYHCIKRVNRQIHILECPMDAISLKNIQITSSRNNSISFNDGIHSYSFNISKSVLMMRFPDMEPLMKIDVHILEDPIEILQSKLTEVIRNVCDISISQQIILPLYSPKSSPKKVQEKSGLNQWNAGGRKRNLDEAYIPIPAWMHKKFKGFFPPRDTVFKLMLPNDNFLMASICQDGDKALMSNPNKRLGEWILRDILKARRGNLITYDRLKKLGVDSVTVKKTGNKEYAIDFASEGSYDDFEKENN